LHIGSAVFPKRKPNTKDKDVASEQNTKKNHDKNNCTPRHGAGLQPMLAATVKIKLQLSRKKSEWDPAFAADFQKRRPAISVEKDGKKILAIKAAIDYCGGATHENIHLYLCFVDVDRATVRPGG